MKKSLDYLYLILAAIQVYAVATGHATLQFASKPLLMVLLVAYYIAAVEGNWNPTHKLMVAAFCFSWVGDVALMLVEQNENFFLLGLVGFLITHILYTVAFAKVTNREAEALFPKKIWVTAPLLIYMGALLSLLIPAIYGNEHNRPVLVPVLVYTGAISVMVAFAINRFKRVSDKSFLLVFAGALLFMVSDSIIAISKFLSPFETAGIFIMVLYMAGQYLIAKGMLRQFLKTKP